MEIWRRSRRWSPQRVQLGLLILGLLQSILLSSLFISDRFAITCVEALAAAKNKRRGRKASGGGKGNGGFGGFGAPPPTLDDFLATVKKTRRPSDAAAVPCPCGASKDVDDQSVRKTYAECCAPLHDGGGCTTPLQVLQSRYVAFAYRNIGHVIRTTHEKCRDYREDTVAWAKDLDKAGMFDSFEFVGLEVQDDDDDDDDKTEEEVVKLKDDNEAFLEFQVRLKGRSREEGPTRSRSLSSIEGEETVVSERSRFLRDPETGTWKYAGGDVRSTVQGLEDTSLNA